MSSNILNILNDLESQSRSTIKLQILSKEKNNTLLQQVFNLALNPYVQFYIRKIPKYVSNETITLEDALLKLEDLSSRKVTGHAGIDHLKNILENLHKDDAKVVERIIKKDLRCGVAESTVNKVFIDLIPTYPCLLAKPYDENNIKNIEYPAYSQIKSDGVRINIVVDGDAVTYCGRSGKSMELHGIHDDYFISLGKDAGYPCVFDGEALIMREGRVLPRSIGNGVINKAIKYTISKQEAASVVFHLWDMIPLDEFKNGKSIKTYKDRMEELHRTFGSRVFMSSHQPAHAIDTRIVNSLKEAQDHFQECIAEGLEGTILKNLSGVWEDKRSKDLVKFKSEKECDLVVIGWNPGTPGTKNDGKMGSLICASSDGKVQVSISGFSDELRDEISMNPNLWIGKIVSIKYNERIKSDEKGREDIDSLFLPRFVEERLDKTTADNSTTI